MPDMRDITKECSACCDELPNYELVSVESDLVCHDCIRAMFINAINDESNYPPRWGGKTELSCDDFEPILGPKLASEYTLKLKEYETPWINRVYCDSRSASGESCGGFVGKKTTVRIRNDCPKCNTAVCLCCKDRIVTLGSHRCDESATADEKDFQGLKRGKDWQKCPSCHNKFVLKDGCNHVQCFVCEQSLCFVCGQPAEGNSNHWSQAGGSRCPRWNQPGASNAIFDDEAPTPNPLAGLFDDIPLPQEADDDRRRRLQRPHERGLTVAEAFARLQPARRAREHDEEEAAARGPVRRQRVTGPTHIDLDNVARHDNVFQPRPVRVRVHIPNTNQANPIHAHPQPRRRRTAPTAQQLAEAAHPEQPRARRPRLSIQQMQVQRDRERAIRAAAERQARNEAAEEEARRREAQRIQDEIHERMHRRAAEERAHLEAAERALALAQEATFQAERLHVEAQQAAARARQAHEAVVAQLARVEAHQRGEHVPLANPAPRFAPRNPSLDFTFRFPIPENNRQAMRLPGPEHGRIQPATLVMPQQHTSIDALDLDDTLVRLRQVVNFTHPNLPGV